MVLVRVIAKTRLKEFWKSHPYAEQPLLNWYKAIREGKWMNLGELKTVFPHADQVGHHTVFNIGGNKYRLIAAIHYNTQRVYVRFVLTHAEYDLEKWKDD